MKIFLLNPASAAPELLPRLSQSPRNFWPAFAPTCALLLTVSGCAFGDSVSGEERATQRRAAQTRIAQAPRASNAPLLDSPALPAKVQRTALDDYVAREEPKFRWEVVKRAGNVTSLKVVSQEWQGGLWTHRVDVIRPAKLEFPDLALVMVSYGEGGEEGAFYGQLAANGLGATFVNVWAVPNQPLFERREDDLIAHTFQKYFETGDETWPLLLPMTKSVVKAMDAVQEFSRDEWKQPITRYVVTGASKRGWTSWLTAAVDKRVAGIIPMVYDNLNLAAQMPHQLESWGAYSEQIEDYTKRGLQAMMQTPRGQKLVEAVDPYSYRDRYTMPKLIINGSNDRYWPLDAFNLYRRDLPAPTQLFYAPNSGHALGGNELRVAGTSVAWLRAWAGGKELPSFNLRLSVAGSVAPVAVEKAVQTPVEIKPGQRTQLQLLVSDAELLNDLGGLKATRVWIAHSPTRDFRQSKWQATNIVEPQEKFRGGRTPSIALPPMPGGMKFGAAFAEWEIATKPTPLNLSSPVVLWQSGG